MAWYSQRIPNLPPGGNPATTDPVAIKANILHAEASVEGFRSVLAYIGAGEILCAKKAALGHGRWIPWVEANLTFSLSTASYCIKFFLHRDILTEAQPPSINEALRLINRRVRQCKIDQGLRVMPPLEEMDEEKRLTEELIEPLQIARKNLRKLAKEPQFDPLIMAAKSRMIAELYRLADDLNEIVF